MSEIQKELVPLFSGLDGGMLFGFDFFFFLQSWKGSLLLNSDCDFSMDVVKIVTSIN